MKNCRHPGRLADNLSAIQRIKAMKRLRSDWLTAHWKEEELPRYELLDYAKGLHREMDAGRLFPLWEDAYADYTSMKLAAEALDQAEQQTPGFLRGLDPTAFRLLYTPDTTTPGYQAIEQARERIAFARPLLKRAMQRSEMLRKQLIREVELSLVGLALPNRKEGVLLLRKTGSDQVAGWVYSSGIQTNARYLHSAIRLTPCGLYTYSLLNTLDRIRDDCKRRVGWAGLPITTWLAEAKTPMPVFSALKPLAMMRLTIELMR